jgi:hypothetical protein
MYDNKNNNWLSLKIKQFAVATAVPLGEVIV